jgi:hypothetical protein
MYIFCIQLSPENIRFYVVPITIFSWLFLVKSFCITIRWILNVLNKMWTLFLANLIKQMYEKIQQLSSFCPRRKEKSICACLVRYAVELIKTEMEGVCVCWRGQYSHFWLREGLIFRPNGFLKETSSLRAHDRKAKVPLRQDEGARAEKNRIRVSLLSYLVLLASYFRFVVDRRIQLGLWLSYFIHRRDE